MKYKSATRKKICGSSLEFPGAAYRECKMEMLFKNILVHAVEKFWDALHLIDHHPLFLTDIRLESGFESMRIGGEFLVGFGIEQIHPHGFFGSEMGLEEARFATTPWPKQEKAVRFRQVNCPMDHERGTIKKCVNEKKAA